MGYDLPERVVKDIVTFAKRYSVRKVILFGSRARGNNTERSDIDIAVYDLEAVLKVKLTEAETDWE